MSPEMLAKVVAAQPMTNASVSLEATSAKVSTLPGSATQDKMQQLFDWGKLRE